jgi:hypothetical protein
MGGNSVSVLGLVSILFTLASPALGAEEGVNPIDDRDTAPRDHFELSMGFIGGQRSYAGTNFVQESDGPALDLKEPFERDPYRRVTTLGVRYDARLVVSYVRMTAGFDLPFAVYRGDATTREYDVSGETRTVSSRSLKIRALRFGIGGELPFSPVTPFVDLMGSVNWIDTQLDVDQVSRKYGANTFGFSVRGGVRLEVRRWFFASVAGEVGLESDVLWGGELSVGFSTL